MKIRLSLTKNYCKDWGVWEGLRELLQNWLDADDGGQRGVRYESDRQRLTMSNLGVTISPADVGLLGRSNKGPEKRGQFGEGLKIGILALVRAGLGVSIRSGDRWYTATLEHAPEFEEEVLTFDSGRTETTNMVSIEVDGLQPSDWAEARSRVLPIRERAYLAHKNEAGEILLDPEEKGRVYCKGIFVRAYEDLENGYNLTGNEVKVDRDRRMVDDFDLNWHLSRMEAERLKSQNTTPESYLDQLECGSRGTRHAVHFLGEEEKEKIAEVWESRHGPRAVPGTAPHSSVKGVAVNSSLDAVLAEHRVRKLSEAEGEVAKTYEISSLPEPEQVVYDSVVYLIEQAGIDMPPLEIVDFINPGTSFHHWGHLVSISRGELCGAPAFLRTLVEVLGGDPHDVYTDIVSHLAGWEE